MAVSFIEPELGDRHCGNRNLLIFDSVEYRFTSLVQRMFNCGEIRNTTLSTKRFDISINRLRCNTIGRRTGVITHD